MDASESENEDFQSADEFVSDDEPTVSVSVNVPLAVKPEIRNSNVVPSEIVDKSSDTTEEPAETLPEPEENYRKRPERKRAPPEEPKTKSMRPEAILSDLTGHFTSELSKGLVTLTATSSTLGSKVGSLVKEIVSAKEEEEVEFDYDDDRTVDHSEMVHSAINEEIMKLSDAFVKLNAARSKEMELCGGEIKSENEPDDKQESLNCQNSAEISKQVEENPGWDECNDVEVSAEAGKWETVDEKAANDGWDDWGDEQVEDAEKPSVEDNDGWDDWGDGKKDADGWGDWGDDDEPVKAEKRKTTQEWSGWETFGQKKETTWSAGWGINSLLSTATAVTSNLSQGISTVIESGLGVPDPETLARIQKEEEEKNASEAVKPSDLFPLRHLVGKIVEVAKVQEIGSRVLTGGLDTLETIGKKTMEVLQEGDPGLKKKRALIVNQGQMLSQVLKEARDRAVADEKSQTVRRRQFETLFDDFQGLVHLEALEMLSKQCEIQIESIKQSAGPLKLQELLDTLDEVSQLCEIDDDFDDVDIEDFRSDILSVAAPLKNELSVEKILTVHERLSNWLASKDGDETAVDQIYDEAISTIAELTAAVTMQFHKSGELLLLKERRKTVEEADCLMQVSSHLCGELKSVSEKCTQLLKKQTNADVLVGNLKIESENAVAYVKQAFRLLVPVLQLGAT